MDYVEVIKRIKAEHETIRGNLKLVGETISDREAVQHLETMRSSLLTDFKSTASEKQGRLESTIAQLESGLKNHYAFEEKNLPPLLGEFLTEALVLEHEQLLAEVVQAKTIVQSSRLKNLSGDALITEEGLLYGMIDRIKREKEEHLIREEAMLSMLEHMFEARLKVT